MKRLLLVLMVVLAGCATQSSYMDRAEQAVQNRQWEAAYRFLEDGFASNKPETKARALALFKAHSEIRTAAFSTFSNDSLRESRVRYGVGSSREIENNRLQMYMQAADFVDYQKAEANMERSFSDLAEQEFEKKQLARLLEEQRKKTADENDEKNLIIANEKRRAAEIDNARRMESRLRIERSLEAAIEKSRVVCKDKLECDKVFSLTQIFIANNSDMKIQVANETIIDTYNATEGMKTSLKAIKMPRSGSAAEILISVNCRDEGRESFKDFCDSKSLRIYSEFPKFVRTNLIR